MKKLSLVLVAAIVALLPAGALAHDDEADVEDSFALRINGVFHLEAGEHVDTAVVINGDAEIAGTVHGTLVVINGDIEITSNGVVEGSVVAVSGEVALRAGSTVGDDLVLVRSELVRSPGSVVGGDVRRRSAYFGFGTLGVLLSIYLWLATTVIVLVAGLVFAAVGGRQLGAIAGAMRERTGATIVAGLVTWIGLPLLAIASFLTIIGVPLGLSLLLIVVPALGFLGYLSTGAFVGSLILPARDRLYLPVLLGLAILQVIWIIPVMGWVTGTFASAWGAGGIVYVAWRGIRGGPPATEPAPVA